MVQYFNSSQFIGCFNLTYWPHIKTEDKIVSIPQFLALAYRGALVDFYVQQHELYNSKCTLLQIVYWHMLLLRLFFQVCQLHRSSCLKICYPYYRSCMCSFGFKFYCWFCSIKRLETTVHTPPSMLFRSRNFNLSCTLLLCQSSKAFHLSIFHQSLYCLLLIK